MLTKKKVKEMMKIKGEVRGEAIKVDLDFVRERKGEKGLKKLEAKKKELGYPLKYDDIKSMGFYPFGYSVLQMTLIQELFNFSDKELEEWGASVIKFSILMKIFMKYFVSLDLIAKQIPDIWRKHYTIGDLEMNDYSKKDKYVILKLTNFKIDPTYCGIYRGYFAKTAEMVIKAKIKCKETKCMFRGDPYHEFLLTW